MSGHRRQPLLDAGPAAEFARRLRALRDERGLTLRELAARSGYSLASMSTAESGRRVPSWAVVSAFVQSCDSDPKQWRQLWEVARSSNGPAGRPQQAADPDSAATPIGAPTGPDHAPHQSIGRRSRGHRRRGFMIGWGAGLAVVVIVVMVSIQWDAGPSPLASSSTRSTHAAPEQHPVRSSGTVAMTPGEYLDLDARAPWSSGLAPDPPSHDLTFSATRRTLLSDNAPSVMILGVDSRQGYSDCLNGNYGETLEPAGIKRGVGMCVTTKAGRRALIVITNVRADTTKLPDRLTVHITVWEHFPDPAHPAVPPHATYDAYACVGTDVPISVALRPAGDPSLAGWHGSMPTPWDALQCADQIWWTPYVNGGSNPAESFSWIFTTSISAAATCTLWAYYSPPPSGHSGGTAHYSINDGVDSSAPQLKYLAVAQTDFWGTWQGLGTYTFKSGHINVTLDNSGNHDKSQQGVIAGPLHAACT